MSLHLGLDLGATNLKWSLVEHAIDWMQVDQGQLPTRVAGGPDAIVEQLATLASDLVAAHRTVASIGIGVPGRYDPEAGTTRFLPNVPGDWAGRPVAEPVAARTGVATALINDARAFGLAELRLGAGRGARTMIGLTLGTGVGGAIAIDGRIHLGLDGTAGEIGHQTIDPDGLPCTCGNRGCLEAYARADRIMALCGTGSVEEAVRRASAGDEHALRGLAEVGRYLGVGIANMIVVLTPERVVIGGGVSGAGELLLRPIREELVARVHMTALDRVVVVVAQLGIWAGSVGAAVHGAERVAAASGGPPIRTSQAGGRGA